jgi:hypothetical protein
MVEPIVTNVIDRLQEQIRLANAKGDFAEVTRLAALATRANELQNEAQLGGCEPGPMTASLPAKAGADRQDSFPSPATAAPGKGEMVPQGPASGHDDAGSSPSFFVEIAPLIVVIDWPAAGIAAPEQVIAFPKASATLQSFATRIWRRMGIGKLAMLHAVRTGRGPLVSNRPTKEFVNGKTGKLFAHHPIGDSGWYVITHSSTSEKIDHIRKAASLLHLRVKVDVNDAVRIDRPPEPEPEEGNIDQI